jgi:hypothetical protein
MNSNKIIPSTNRIICDNALHLIKKEAEQLRTRGLRHSFTFDDSVDDIINKIETNINIVKTFNKTAEFLQTHKFSKDQMMKLVQQILPAPKLNQVTTKLISKREDIVNRFANGIGTEGKTMWDALNAVTEYESRKQFSPEKLIRTLNSPTLSNRALEILVA